MNGVLYPLYNYSEGSAVEDKLCEDTIARETKKSIISKQTVLPFLILAHR